MKFSKCEITTITCNGCIYAIDHIKNYIHSYPLAVELSKLVGITFRYIKYIDKFVPLSYNNKHFINKSEVYPNPWFMSENKLTLQEVKVENATFRIDGKNVVVSIICGDKYHKKKINKEKKILDFKNSFTIEIDLDNNRVANCKIYTNGTIQLTGCRSIDEAKSLFSKLNTIFLDIEKKNNNQLKSYRLSINDVKPDTIIPAYLIDEVKANYTTKPVYRFGDLDKGLQSKVAEHYINFFNYKNLQNNLIFNNKINIHYTQTACMMTIIHVEDGKYIDQLKLFNYIESLDDIQLFPIFENCNNKALQLNYIAADGIIITYMIFHSGKIVMTHVISNKHIEDGYQFITKFLNDNIEHVFMESSIDKTISLIKTAATEKSSKQGSIEWLKARLSCITATELAYIMIKDYKYGTLEQYIENKRKAIKLNDPTINVIDNPFTEHGKMFEHIAAQIYVRMINSSSGNTSKTSSSTNKILHYNAGFYKKDCVGASPDGFILKMSENYDVSYEDCNNLKLLDNKTFQNNIVDTYLLEIKCPTKYVPVKYSLLAEKEHYYWQVQQQLYTTGLKYAHFIQCDFHIYCMEKDFWNDKKSSFKGIIYVRDDSQESKYYYPEDITDTKEPDHIKYKSKIFWRLNAYDICEVDFNKEMYFKALSEAKKVWYKINSE